MTSPVTRALVANRGAVGAAVAAAACLCALWACGSNESSDDPIPSSEVDAGDSNVGRLVDDAGNTPDVHAEYTCSPDLRSVLRDGAVTKTCADDQGCEFGTGECVSACESAKSNGLGSGCEYYVVPHELSGWTFCTAVLVANAWSTPATLSADYAGTHYAPSDVEGFARIAVGGGRYPTYQKLTGGQIPPNSVAVVFVAGRTCPGDAFPPSPGAIVRGTTIVPTFRITSDRPVTAHYMNSYNGADGAIEAATLLLPTSTWDTNYIAFDPYSRSTAVAPATSQLAIHVVAQDDDTQVTMLPSADVPGVPDAGVVGASKNTPATYTLQKGEMLKLVTDTGLNGSIFQSDKPIGMWTSTLRMSVPVDTLPTDAEVEQLPPVRSFGSEYVGVRYRNRVAAIDESPPWRIMGAVDGTKLTYEPETPPGAHTIVNRGEVFEFNYAGPIVVKSQDGDHPFYMAQYMTSCSLVAPDAGSGLTGCLGDPEMMNVVPTKQYDTSYLFTTDRTFPATSLVVVRSKVSGAYAPVTLECAGELGDWKPINGDYEYTRIDLSVGDFKGVGGCDLGVQRLSSKNPFMVNLWGWGSDESSEENPPVEDGGTPSDRKPIWTQGTSYGFQAGVRGTPVNGVRIPPVPR